MNGLVYEYRAAVQHTDIDLNGNMKLSSLMSHLQTSGTLQLDNMGLTYEVLTEKNVVFLLSKIKININRCLRTDKIITVKTWPKCIKGVLYYRDYIVYGENREIIAEASSAWTAVDIMQRKILRPSGVDINIPHNPELSVSFSEIDKFAMPKVMDLAYIKTVRYSDLDTNRHMNNTVYADVILNALPEIITGKSVKNITISFRNECVDGDRLNVFTAFENGRYFINGENDSKISFEAVLELTD